MLKEYIKEIAEITSRGDSREEGYYSTLERLLKEYAPSIGKKKIQITTLPKSTEAGNPDFRVWDGKEKIVGYIKARNPAIDNLDTIENSEQLRRYRHTFSQSEAIRENHYSHCANHGASKKDRQAVRTNRGGVDTVLIRTMVIVRPLCHVVASSSVYYFSFQKGGQKWTARK